MGQLIKITSTDYKAVHIRGAGKFVPSDQIEAERRKALQHGITTARQAEIESQSFSQEINSSYNRVNASIDLQKELDQLQNRKPTDTAGSSALSAASKTPETAPEIQNTEEKSMNSAVVSAAASPSTQDLNQESNSNYYQELGALEMRVQRGDLSFVPPLDMTIVVQKPEINIEYTGDFNYFPKPVDTGSNVNLET